MVPSVILLQSWLKLSQDSVPSSPKLALHNFNVTGASFSRNCDSWQMVLVGLGNCCCYCSVMKSSLTLVQPHGLAHQTPVSMGLSRQEYWNGLPFPSPGDLSDPGIEPAFPVLAGGFFTTEPPGKPFRTTISTQMIIPITQKIRWNEI